MLAGGGHLESIGRLSQTQIASSITKSKSVILKKSVDAARKCQDLQDSTNYLNKSKDATKDSNRCLKKVDVLPAATLSKIERFRG